MQHVNQTATHTHVSVLNIILEQPVKSIQMHAKIILVLMEVLAQQQVQDQLTNVVVHLATLASIVKSTMRVTTVLV